MGTAVVRRLRGQGFETRGWNRTPMPSEGVPVYTDIASAVNGADTLILFLSDAAAIEQTFFGPSSPGLKGKTLIQMGTIGPGESREFARRCKQQNATWIEAPVLGSIPEASSGTLIIMAGGNHAEFARVRPVLQSLSSTCRLVGEVGKGAALKLAMNQLIGGLTASFATSLSLVRSEGVDPDDFMSLLRTSSLYAPTFDKKLEKMLTHDYANPNFPLKHLVKDIRLFRETALSNDIDTSLQGALLKLLEKGIATGHGDEDYSSLAEVLVKPD
jgi:3-hydroxyisobutyrate dehydrogenase-like beta-hydroxyacid dehydrogenase